MRLACAPVVIAAVPASVLPVGIPGVESWPAKPPTTISPSVVKRFVSEPGLAVVPVPLAPTNESTGEREPGCQTFASATMPPPAPIEFVQVKAYGPASPANFFQSRAVQTVVPLQVWPIDVQPVAATASAFRFETWATRIVEPLTSVPVGFASESDAVAVAVCVPFGVITVIAGSIT